MRGERAPHIWVLVIVALIYTAAGLLPDHVFAPLDIPRDFDAWKASPAQRVRVSNTLLSDVAVQFAPWDAEVRRLVLGGEFPWVNRFAGTGALLFANPQVALLSPFTWPRLLFGLRGWAISAFLKLFCAAVGMWSFARVCGGDRSSALVSAVVYAGSAAFITALLFPHTNVLAILPALAAACTVFKDKPTDKGALLVITFAALVTAGGHPETLFVGVVSIAAFLIADTVKRRGNLRDVGRVAAASAIGFLILGMQLVPFVEVLTKSYARYARTAATGSSFAWPTLPALALPGYLGSPVRGDLDLTAILPRLYNFNQRSIGYVGLITVVCVALAWRDLSSRVRTGAVIGLVGLALSLQLPVITTALRHVPLFGWVAPEYFAYAFVLFISAAAGPAVVAVVRARRPAVAAVLGVTAVLLVVGGLLLALPGMRPFVTSVSLKAIEILKQRHFLRQPPEVYEARLPEYLSAIHFTMLHRFVLPGIAWLGAAIALRRRSALLLGGAIAAELLFFGAGFNPAIRGSDIAPLPSLVRDVHRLDPKGEFLIGANFEVFPANLGTSFGVRDVVSYDVLESRERVEQLMRGGYDPVLHTLPPVPNAEQLRALADLGVRFYLSSNDVSGARRVTQSSPPGVSIYELPGAVPQGEPENAPPSGFTFGCVVSAIALLAAVVFVGMQRRGAARA